MIDPAQFGLGAEPLVQDSMTAGVGLAMFSGDKLLGGPQAGIIVGKKGLVAKLKKHPLARAVRSDKTRLAALSATMDLAGELVPGKRVGGQGDACASVVGAIYGVGSASLGSLNKRECLELLAEFRHQVRMI